MTKPKMNRKHIYIADAVIILCSIAIIAGLISYSRPVALSPLDDLVTGNSTVIFSFEKGEAVLIDDSPDFTSPERIVMENNASITLKPGTYYWKVSGVIESSVRQLTIESVVDLRLRDAGEQYELVNAGNTELQVEVYGSNTLRETIIIPTEGKASSRGDSFTGRQNE